MNRETVNMVRSPISVEGNIRLVPYYPAYDTALAWYQDAQLCKQVDNRDFVYDLPLLKRMYHYLDTHGELFYIEYRGVLCGDVSLRTTGELAIVICKEYQNKTHRAEGHRKNAGAGSGKRLGGVLRAHLFLQYPVAENV